MLLRQHHQRYRRLLRLGEALRHCQPMGVVPQLHTPLIQNESSLIPTTWGRQSVLFLGDELP